MNPTFLLWLFMLLSPPAADHPPLFHRLAKTDSHVHLCTFDSAFAQQARADRFRLVTILVGATDSIAIQRQRHWAVAQAERFPGTVRWITTFSLQGFEEPGWQKKTIDRLRRDFAAGAIGVKVWKDIGMVIRDHAGRFVMIDEAFGRGSDESSRYGLRLFRELNLQLLIVTPLQKIHIIEPFVSTLGFVYNDDGSNSKLQVMSIESYRAKKSAGEA